MDHEQHLVLWGHIASVAAIVTSLVGIVPAIAGVVALIWYLIQIFESKTIQRWRANRRAKKIARLRAKIVLLEAADLLSPVLPPDDGG